LTDCSALSYVYDLKHFKSGVSNLFDLRAKCVGRIHRRSQEFVLGG